MAVKFQTNVPLLLHFPFGDAKETQGQYGPQFQYTVNHEHAQGQKDALYASPALHTQLEAIQPGLKGYSFWITKREDGTRKYFEVCWEDGTPVAGEPVAAPEPAVTPPPTPPPPPPKPPPAPPAARPAAPAPKPPIPPSAVPSPPQQPAAPPSAIAAIAAAMTTPGAPIAVHKGLHLPVTVASLGGLLRECLSEAVGAWGGLHLQCTSDNIQAHASLLFIAAKEAGLGREKATPTTSPPTGQPKPSSLPSHPPPEMDVPPPVDDDLLPF